MAAIGFGDGSGLSGGTLGVFTHVDSSPGLGLGGNRGRLDGKGVCFVVGGDVCPFVVALGSTMGFFAVKDTLLFSTFPPENFRILSLMLIGGSRRSC